MMKKNLFILMAVMAFAFASNVANAQLNETSPYQGGTYSYSVDGIFTVTGATVEVEYLTGAGATIQNLSDATLLATTAGTTETITFDVVYSTTATAGKIRLTLTENGCENFIELAITPLALPTLDLAVAATDTEVCQDINLGVLADNTPASDGQTGNTITFTVTPTVSIASGFDYVYTIDFANVPANISYVVTKTDVTGGTYNSGTGVVTKSGDDTSTDEFTLTFTTTTGVPDEVVTASFLSATLTVTSGGADYDSPSASTASTTVKTLPTIGGFN